MSEFFDIDPVRYDDPFVSEDPPLTTDGEADGYLSADDDLNPPDQTESSHQTDDVAGMPSELQFGSLNGPDGVTQDSYARPYDYNHGTGTTLDTAGREIDPWTGTAKK